MPPVVKNAPENPNKIRVEQNYRGSERENKKTKRGSERKKMLTVQKMAMLSVGWKTAIIHEHPRPDQMYT